MAAGFAEVLKAAVLIIDFSAPGCGAGYSEVLNVYDSSVATRNPIWPMSKAAKIAGPVNFFIAGVI